MRKAARQIRDPRFHGGVIIVDLTDCIDAGLRFRFGDEAPQSNPVHGRVHELMTELHREIFVDAAQRLRRSREHVFSLICFARSTYWDLSSLSFPYLSRYVGTVDYWRNDPGTLRAHRARWLGTLIHRGIVGAGHQQEGGGKIELGG